MAASNSLDHLSNRMKLEWHSKLNTEMVPAKNFRRTSIIGTIGMSLFRASVSFAMVSGSIVLMSIFFRSQDQLDREDQRAPQRYGDTRSGRRQWDID